MENRDYSFEEVEQALRQSWETHRQAFGPILEPAFQENPQVRIILINALNHISRREIKEGMDLLKQIHQYCVYDEDRAAWTFFVGLGFEMAGAREQMLQWYSAAGEYKHRFYLPYLKLAKAAHTGGEYDKAGNYYQLAIDCLLEMDDNEKDDIILGSAYTNLCSCLTMLHLYQAAEKAWESAARYPLQPGADATAAIMYAAMGEREKCAAHLAMLEQKQPAWAGQTRAMTQQILLGLHPSFPSDK